MPEPAHDPRATMTAMRREIDALDAQLSELLARRVQCAHTIGVAKKALGLPIYDATREAAIAESVTAHLDRHGLRPFEVPVLDIYRTLVLVCRHAQDDPTLDGDA